MENIYKLDSDSDVLDELWTWLRNRNIEQKFIYFWEWGKLYYQWKFDYNEKNKTEFLNQNFLDFLEKNNILNTKQWSSIISLWCWDSIKEYSILKKLNNKKINFIWVDSSEKMLEISRKNLKYIKNEKKFLCADFSKKSFRLELEQLTKDNKNRVFVFFSNTFWNIEHTNIIDILWNLLKKWEKIWLDVVVRKWTWIKNDIEISKMTSDIVLKKELSDKFFKNTLINLWINSSSIELFSRVKKENFINSLKFDFFYYFKDKQEIEIKWEKIIILPWEEIKFLQIYAYERDWFIKFFNEHWFDFIDSNIKDFRGQFLFQKR